MCVDSLGGPTVVSATAGFDVLVWAVVGPNGCYQFKLFQTIRDRAQLDLKVIGEHQAGELSCAAAQVELRAARLRVVPPIADSFTVVAHQPDGSILTRVFHVE